MSPEAEASNRLFTCTCRIRPTAANDIDGIGFESHFIVNELPSNIQQNMEAFTALGVEIAIPELDIRMTLPSTTTLLS